MSELANRIEFAPHIGLSDADRDLVMNWETLNNQVDARESKGFTFRKIFVTGVSLVGQGEKRRPLMVQARVTYLTPEFGEATYHTNFIPDAATLLVVFRMVNKEATSQEPAKLDDHFVLLVNQARIGFNSRLSPEIPGGLIGENGEAPKLAALREMIEESVSEQNRNLLPNDLSEKAVSIGKPALSHPALTDKQHQFAVTIDVTPAALAELQKAFTGTRAGEKKETEQTIVEIVPLRQAYNDAIANGSGTLIAFTRYMLSQNLLKLAA
jgi:hypothetical protein